MALLKTFPLDGDPGYGFEWLRAWLELTLQEGVIGAGDFKVTVAAAGGNRVDVAAGWATVKGDTGVPALGLTQGLYLQGNDATIASALTFDPGDPSNPRLDQVVLYVADSSDLGSAGSAPSLGIVKGNPVAGTTLDTGYTNGSAAALPPNALRLADRLVPAGANTIAATDLRDRRKFARGARGIYSRSAGNLTTTSTVFSPLSTSDFQRRFEFGGGPVVARVLGRIQQASAGQWSSISLHDNGAPINPIVVTTVAAANGNIGPSLAEYEGPIAAGSHLLEPYWRSSDGSLVTALASAPSEAGLNGPLVFSVRENVTQLADNT